MARAAFLQPAADALHLDGEAAVPQALLEPAILPRRPDRQHAPVLERRARRRQPADRRTGVCCAIAVNAAGPLSTSSSTASKRARARAQASRRRRRSRPARAGPSADGPASGPSGPRFHSTTAGTSSATTTVASGGSRSSVARSVKPMPRPPTSTHGCVARRAPRGSRTPRALLRSRACGSTSAACRSRGSRTRCPDG